MFQLRFKCNQIHLICNIFLQNDAKSNIISMHSKTHSFWRLKCQTLYYLKYGFLYSPLEIIRGRFHYMKRDKIPLMLQQVDIGH